MTKKYISKSDISINASGVHVSFSALTGGGSVFYTDNKKLQDLLEKHPKFGKLFKLAETVTPAPAVKKPAAAQPEAPKGPKQIMVSCLEDAKEYLVDNFGISRTKLRSAKAIKDTAALKNIEFVGI